MFMIAFVFTFTLLYTHYTERPNVIELVIKQTNPVHNIWTDNRMLDNTLWHVTHDVQILRSGDKYGSSYICN